MPCKFLSPRERAILAPVSWMPYLNRSTWFLVKDDLSLGRRANIEHVLEHERFRFVYGTILDYDLME